MSRSVLFGYTVERDDGKIVITLSGSMAGTVLDRMAHRGGGRGRGNPAAALFPFGALGSASVSLAPLFEPQAEIEPEPEEAESFEDDLKDVFGQGFDRNYQDFETRLVAYRELLTAPAEPAPAAAVAPAPVPVTAAAPAEDDSAKAAKRPPAMRPAEG